MSEKTVVRIIDYTPEDGKGWRHERLIRIWETIAEHEAGHMILKTFPNSHLSHGAAYQRIWDEEERDAPNRYVVFTEHDFLPDLSLGRGRWLKIGREDVMSEGDGGYAAVYCTRHPHNYQLVEQPRWAGGWFVFLDKVHTPLDLQFQGQPDACNQLGNQFPTKTFSTVRGTDNFPRHYGVSYFMGTHLFWYRHLHTDPRVVISGFMMRGVQQKHDKAVDMWVAGCPDSFQDLLLYRCGPEIMFARMWAEKHAEI